MTPWLDDGDVRIHLGDVLEVLPTMPDGSVDCVITSPPYWGLRDYGTGSWTGGDPDCDHARPHHPYPDNREGVHIGRGKQSYAKAGQSYGSVCGKCGARRVDQQLGLEPTPDAYVTNMVAVFREVRRVLADHGTAFVNLGDSYVAAQGGRQSSVGEMPAAPLQQTNTPRDRDDVDTGAWGVRDVTAKMTPARGTTPLKPKDLVGIPWRVAFALQADGWYLRSDIIWAKPNPMPESVTDRPTKAHEYVFLLSKRPRYWFDAEAVREPHTEAYEQWVARYAKNGRPGSKREHANIGQPANSLHSSGWIPPPANGRNVRSVWQIATQPYAGAHFATYPEELVRRCLLAGCPVRVCRVCGKPSERVTRSTYTDTRPGGNGRGGGEGFRGSGVRVMAQGRRLEKDVETLGWSDCGHNDWRPGIVLDPFLGSGTTAKVARDHARHAIGIELNEAYARLAADRLRQLSLLADGSAA